MNTAPLFDADLLRRYDRPGPRYTSYPTAPHFGEDFDAVALREVIHASNDEPIPRQLSLYVHVPFCNSPCFYCGCNRIITRDTARGAAYLVRLYREIALVAKEFDRDRRVVQLHFGGGTPNFLSPAQLAEVVDVLQGQFRFSPAGQRELSIELDPRFIAPDDVAVLAKAGFNRASLGVQDFDPAVQRAVNRIQGVEETLEIIRACHDNGFRSVNIDLIYGLPGQNATGFARTLETVISARPERLAIYSYAHLPKMFKAQRHIDESLLPSPEEKLGLLKLAVEALEAAGYIYIGMDHFALPDDDLASALDNGSLQRNFMGYTTHAQTDLVGFGVSAISHIGDSFSQNPRLLPAWEAALDNDRLPVWRGMRMSADDRLRADLIQQLMCHRHIDIAALEARHGIDFGQYFADPLERLKPLADDGLVEIQPGRIDATTRGRLLLRIISMCFDAYLPVQPRDGGGQFSKVI